MSLNQKVKDELTELCQDLTKTLESIKKQVEKDLAIDESDLEVSLFAIPKILSKYSGMVADQGIRLKDLYSLSDKVKLERWKYYAGKQTDRYYNDHGILHEKILKSDIDMYLSADEKIGLINSIIATQKAIVDYLERSVKEIQSRNFHIKAVIDWRKFISGSGGI